VLNPFVAGSESRLKTKATKSVVAGREYGAGTVTSKEGFGDRLEQSEISGRIRFPRGGKTGMGSPDGYE